MLFINNNVGTWHICISQLFMSLRFVYRKCNVIAIYISQMQCHCDLYIANAKDIAIYISQVQCHCDLYIANAKPLQFIYRKCKAITISISQMQCHCDLYIASAKPLWFITVNNRGFIYRKSQFFIVILGLEVLAGKAEMGNCCLQSGVKAGIFLKRQNNPRWRIVNSWQE